MRAEKIATISARVTPRIRKLAEAAADLRRTTLSTFAANAIEDSAQRELMGDSTESANGMTVHKGDVDAA